MFSCSWKGCDFTFSKPSRLEAHMRIHSGERPFVCTHAGCSAAYTRQQHLTRHLKSHSAVVNKSPLIDEDDATGESKRKRDCFQCKFDGCGAVFHKRKQLYNHNLRHNVSLKYSCDVEGCGKAFETPSKLKRHSRKHEGYFCTQKDCKRHFSSWSGLRKHVKEDHTRERRCSECDKVFAHRGQLRQHRVIHEALRPVLRCTWPNCDRFYSSEYNLQQHVRSLHLGQRLVCPQLDCSATFSCKQKLQEHEKTHQPNYVPSAKSNKPKVRRLRRRRVSLRTNLVAVEQGEDDQVLTSRLTSLGLADLSSSELDMLQQDMLRLSSDGELSVQEIGPKLRFRSPEESTPDEISTVKGSGNKYVALSCSNCEPLGASDAVTRNNVPQCTTTSQSLEAISKSTDTDPALKILPFIEPNLRPEDTRLLSEVNEVCDMTRGTFSIDLENRVSQNSPSLLSSPTLLAPSMVSMLAHSNDIAQKMQVSSESELSGSDSAFSNFPRITKVLKLLDGSA